MKAEQQCTYNFKKSFFENDFIFSQVVLVVHDFNPSTYETMSGGYLSSRPACSAWQNPG